MKRLLTLTLIIALCLSLGVTAVAETWCIKGFTDGFGDLTNKTYISSIDKIPGFFSNSATTDSDLAVDVMYAENENSDTYIALQLYEYGWSLVKSGRNGAFYDVQIKTEDGDIQKFYGCFWANADRMFLYNSKSDFTKVKTMSDMKVKLFDKILALFLSGQTLKFYMKEENGSSSYRFSINTKGFSEIYKKAYGTSITYDDKATVKTVQEKLNALGYNCGTPDGVAGSKTKEAIKSYQKAKGLKVTGTITDDTLAAINAE